jgi:hypothetical protein
MIPKQLVYQNKVESAAARSYKSNIAPQNGTGNYGAGETIIINIPTRANLVTAMSENYLKFDVSFTSTAASDYLRWDSSGAHGLIQRIRDFQDRTYWKILIIMGCYQRCYLTFRCQLIHVMESIIYWQDVDQI